MLHNWQVYVLCSPVKPLLLAVLCLEGDHSPPTSHPLHFSWTNMKMSWSEEPTQYPNSSHSGGHWIQLLSGAHMYKARMYWFTFPASTAFGFPNLHDITEVSPLPHWKPLSPLTRSNLLVCPLPHATWAQAGIFIVGIKYCQAPSVAAVHAHTLLALTGLPKPCFGARQFWNSWRFREAGPSVWSNCRSCWSPLPPSVPSGLWSLRPVSVRRRTWSSHKQQATLIPGPESKEMDELWCVRLKIL